ncbi:MAG: 1-acyl-sn-glycerol-3-phosphate acyltransferase, partial [Myxococcales bacterium]|nr:1-acyl-sn-glycerol-3-phosphate acyltransferase [Myxococcales bacterium]
MRGQPPQTAARRALRGVISLALRVFFRRIDRVGVERVPARGPVMFVLNHPNALVDPGIALISLPRPVSFLAKSTLFSIPVVSAMVRGVDSIPVARRQDSQGGAVDNTRTFAVAREVLQRGGSIAIFPEGVSHSAPQLKPLRTGAARIALGAGLTDLVIVPVGLDYANKHVFRSAALLYFGAPIQVEPIASGPLEAGVEPPREAVARLTARLERALADVVVQAEQAEALALADRAERILSSVAASAGAAARPAAGERFELRRRILEGYHELKERHRARVDQLVLRLEQHEDALRSVGLAGFGAGLDAGLDVGLDAGLDAPRPGRRVASLRAQAFGLALLAPFALLGAALHYPAYRLIGVLAVRFARDEDDMIATIKVLTAMLLFPVTWVAIGAL